MSGISDVRLTMYARELDEKQKATGHVNAPEGLSVWGLFQRRARTRLTLLGLTDEQLRDIGLSHEQARREGLKPFWRG